MHNRYLGKRPIKPNFSPLPRLAAQNPLSRGSCGLPAYYILCPGRNDPVPGLGDNAAS